ncbi:hypothetical protein ACQ3G6_11610 [Allorhizobium undicola]|uniref:hypothetical protein n=1 Tax=Allorhizobium undicola TaxID=78527 RepID=UPI000487F4D6|nr:hypothetical protein [Allorhizobium undicola]
MNETKPWYVSRTVWGALVAIAAAGLHMSGIDLAVADQAALSDQLVALAGAAGGLLALYGRLRAKKEIAPAK